VNFLRGNPLTHQPKDEIHQRVHRVIMLLGAKAQKLGYGEVVIVAVVEALAEGTIEGAVSMMTGLVEVASIGGVLLSVGARSETRRLS
jgi:hypothetical protein